MCPPTKKNPEIFSIKDMKSSMRKQNLRYRHPGLEAAAGSYTLTKMANSNPELGALLEICSKLLFRNLSRVNYRQNNKILLLRAKKLLRSLNPLSKVKFILKPILQIDDLWAKPQIMYFLRILRVFQNLKRVSVTILIPLLNQK